MTFDECVGSLIETTDSAFGGRLRVLGRHYVPNPKPDDPPDMLRTGYRFRTSRVGTDETVLIIIDGISLPARMRAFRPDHHELAAVTLHDSGRMTDDAGE